MRGKKLPALGLEECIAACNAASGGGTRAFVSGAGVYEKIPDLLEKEFGEKKIFLIADENTLQAAGNGDASKWEEALASGGIAVAGRHIFPGEPRLHADYRHIETLVRKMSAAKDAVPVAVGAGTLNDLAKRAAGELALPYLCVPTAASVDGYTSFGSAVLKDGYKQTLACNAPLCIVADTDVLSRAPSWLSSSGFADLAGKITAGADWIISDAAAAFGMKGSAPVNQKAWAMVQNGLYDYLARSETAVQGDPDALKALFEALSITGFAMQYTQDSRPVSGSEHLYAHIWEMDDLCVNGEPVTHGHKVAIGTLASTAFLEILFSGTEGPPSPPPAFRRPSLEERIAEAKNVFADNPAADSVIATVIEKFPDEKTLADFRDTISDIWKDLRLKVLEQITPYSELKAVFAKAGCPVLPEQVNLKRNEVIACTRRAQMIRCRYNCLDLAWDLGCFQTVLAKMEISSEYFFR